jgi:hypothetical protein
VELSAKVTAIDAENRHVTLEGPQGNSVTIAVDPAVKNFKKIKKGDMVLVKYYESLAWELKKPGEKQAMTKTETQETTTAAAGEKPAREETRTVDLIATIEAIDKETPSVTLKGPEGNSRTIKVKNPKNLKGVKVGDQVAVTYTESLAVSVEKAPKQ